MPPTTIPYSVQLEDGTIETINLDARVPADRVADILDGVMRARSRIKAGQPPVPPVELPNMFGSTVAENAGRFASGLFEPIAAAGHNFMQGARIINHSPSTALSLLTHELPAGVGRNIMKGLEAHGRLESEVGSGQVPTDLLGDTADIVNAIPIVGPMATELGSRTAVGEGPEAVGNLTGQAVLAELAGKYGGKAIRKITAKAPTVKPPTIGVVDHTATPGTLPTPAPTPTPARAPFISSESSRAAGAIGLDDTMAATGNTISTGTPTPIATATDNLHASMAASSGSGTPAQLNTLGGGVDVTPELIDQLRRQLANAPRPATPSKPIVLRLPVRGLATPISIELSGPRLAAARSFLATVRGSVSESAWAQRLVSGLTSGDNQQ